MTVGEMTEIVRVRPHLQSNSNANTNTTNTRHFSRFIKSCCPTPNGPASLIPVNNPIIVVKSKFLTPRLTSIGCLPDDVIYDILSRVPLTSLSSVAAVCRRWAHIVDTHTFTLLRGFHAPLQPTLFVFSLVNNSISFSTVRLFCNDSLNVSRNDVVSLRSDVSHARVTSVGRKVFIVCGFNCFYFDPWTGFIKFRSKPGLSRKRFAMAAVNGRVYVAGGSRNASVVEEYNPDADEWRVVAHAPHTRYGCIGVGIEGVFYIIGGLNINRASHTRASDARAFVGSMDLYDVAARRWLRTRSLPGGGCVVAACGAHGHVYVLASHAVELSFWRFNATRNGGSHDSGGGGGGRFGEWCRMKAPPMAGQMRVGGGVKYTSIGVEDKVVLIQVIGRENKQGKVFIFDCVTHEWSRLLDLPHLLKNIACICVDC